MTKYECSNCGREVDETEYMQYKDQLSSIDEDRFHDSGYCPDCFEAVK